MMPDTIKTIKNDPPRHCEEQRDEAIHTANTMDCRARYRSLAMTKRQQGGNAMIYVLIALALFGFLTITLSRSNDQADGQDIDDEQAELYAIELIEYAASAQAAVDRMIITGSTIDELDFVAPDDADFNTPPHHHKVYHPQGGGLNYRPSLPEAVQVVGSSGWFHSKLSNIEWTPSANLDVSFNALRIPPKICSTINNTITGSTNIPSLATSGLSSFFEEGGANNSIDATECSDCEGYFHLCVVDTTGTFYGYYNIIAAQ